MYFFIFFSDNLYQKHHYKIKQKHHDSAITNQVANSQEQIQN
jgi:hypothetical protein